MGTLLSRCIPRGEGALEAYDEGEEASQPGGGQASLVEGSRESEDADPRAAEPPAGQQVRISTCPPISASSSHSDVGMAETINGTLKVTLVTAKGLCAIGDKEPTSIVRLRILNSDPKDPAKPPAISQVQSSEPTTQTLNTCSPVYNQDFSFVIKDSQNARLDVTVWDKDISVTEDKGFLGEVGPLLNPSKGYARASENS